MRYFTAGVFALLSVQQALYAEENLRVKEIELAAKKPASLKLGVNLIDKETTEFLKQFKANPKKAMNQKVYKFSNDGTAIVMNQNQLDDIQNDRIGKKLSDEFQIATAKFRTQFCIEKSGATQCIYDGSKESIQSMEDVLNSGRRGEASNDKAEDLADNGYQFSGEKRFRKNIYEMAKEDLTNGKVAVQPWSSDYWAIATGITAKRYADENYPQMDNGMVWHELKDYWNTWFKKYGANLDQYMDQLSPAEKYDVLVGDSAFTLTNAQFDEGSGYAFSGGRKKAVETWMGICHGWAPASYMDPRPRKTVIAYTPSGSPVTFRPNDIKALSVLKWANGDTVAKRDGRLVGASRFIGGRCNTRGDDIQRDSETNAIDDKTCFDTNPGAWHKALVNQVGVMKRSFVIDATFDYEVWNQPMVSYKYSYFNPQTMEPVSTLEEAMVPYQFAGDKFRKIRERNYNSASKKPTKVVGIIMEAVYVVETVPMAYNTDSEDQDIVNRVRYKYDLEIAEDGDIVGGEWYSNHHPDFLWTPVPDAFAWNDEDERLSNISYSSSEPLPKQVTNIAKISSANSRPLKLVVDALLQAAAK